MNPVRPVLMGNFSWVTLLRVEAWGTLNRSIEILNPLLGHNGVKRTHALGTIIRLGRYCAPDMTDAL